MSANTTGIAFFLDSTSCPASQLGNGGKTDLTRVSRKQRLLQFMFSSYATRASQLNLLKKTYLASVLQVITWSVLHIIMQMLMSH